MKIFLITYFLVQLNICVFSRAIINTVFSKQPSKPVISSVFSSLTSFVFSSFSLLSVTNPVSP